MLAVVTGGTVVDYPRMLKRLRPKVAGDMTDAAVLRRRNMVQILAACSGPIVTGGAIVDDIGMIKDGIAKVGGVVTYAAFLGCRYMCLWLGGGFE